MYDVLYVYVMRVGLARDTMGRRRVVCANNKFLTVEQYKHV